MTLLEAVTWVGAFVAGWQSARAWPVVRDRLRDTIRSWRHRSPRV